MLNALRNLVTMSHYNLPLLLDNSIFRREQMIQKSIDIWEGFDFLSKSAVNPRPMLTTYVLSGEKVRGAVLILAGGCYTFTAEREAEPVALQYTAAGYNAFVLEYSVAPNRFPQALRDTCRALTLIRQNAADWNTDPDKIAVC